MSYIEKDYAYVNGGNVYFDTSKLDDYYKLTNHEEDSLIEAVRDDVDIDSYDCIADIYEVIGNGKIN